MEVFVYSRQGNQKLVEEGRQGLEDDLEAFLDGAGEVTGGGSGEVGWNIDLEINTPWPFARRWVPRLCGFLRQWGVPPDTYLMVGQQRVDVFENP